MRQRWKYYNGVMESIYTMQNRIKNEITKENIWIDCIEEIVELDNSDTYENDT